MAIKQKLVIDWGNTRVKLGLFQEEDRLIMVYNYDHDEAVAEIMKKMERYNYPTSLLCSVHHHSDELVEALAPHGNLKVLNANTPIPLLNAYGSWESLGMDRLALAVAGHYLFPDHDQLVIAAGTAITYNFTSKGFFRGGAISPGMDIRFKALNKFTDQLPLVERRGMNPLVGHDTETSIRSGVVFGIAAEIESMIEYYKTQYPNTKVVLTGGSTRFFADKMKNEIFADDALILRGLNAIINYNEDKK